MKKHLYNSRLAKVSWFIKRFGAAELVLKPARTLFAPLIIRTLPRKSFRFKERDLPYVFHAYNMTWATERCVEVAIARHYVENCAGKRVLEVGNVLSHYGPIAHDVVDKFERGDHVINQDILEFRPPKNYDLILSISTFEHIGFDDESETSSADKIQEAITACRSLLNPDGSLVMTVPVGYNPELDILLQTNCLQPRAEFYMKRVGKLDWKLVGRDEALAARYKSPFPYANAVVVAEFSALRQ